jgi:catechol 2,3-dioxygenase-like lactoylglutathione lyase family enzyme
VAHRIAALDHVQLAMPPGGESEADAFYCGVLGFTAVAKPEPLASRGGRWYVAEGSVDVVNVHLGVESEFRPARKAHPALRVDGFDDLVAALDRFGAAWREDTELPGVRRLHVEDPFGNRIELIDNG